MLKYIYEVSVGVCIHTQYRGRERIISRFRAQQGAHYGARSHDPEIMTWADIRSQMLNWLSHLGAPKCHYFFEWPWESYLYSDLHFLWPWMGMMTVHLPSQLFWDADNTVLSLCFGYSWYWTHVGHFCKMSPSAFNCGVQSLLSLNVRFSGKNLDSGIRPAFRIHIWCLAKWLQAAGH